MKRIRICEESEARLMIRDGSFQQFVNMWCERFPQKNLITVLLRMRKEYGYQNLKEAKDASELLGIGETILLEVGENVVFRKRFNILSLYQKMGNIWVKRNGQQESVISVVTEEELFGQPEKVLPFYEENEILGAKDLAEFAYSLKEKRILKDWRWPLLKFGNHEIWRSTREGNIKVYSHNPYEGCILNYVNDMVNHIQKYQKKYKTAFGPM